MRCQGPIIDGQALGQCGADLERGIYAGESSAIMESFWTGQQNPICFECAKKRVKKLWSAIDPVLAIIEAYFGG